MVIHARVLKADIMLQSVRETTTAHVEKVERGLAAAKLNGFLFRKQAGAMDGDGANGKVGTMNVNPASPQSIYSKPQEQHAAQKAPPLTSPVLTQAFLHRCHCRASLRED